VGTNSKIILGGIKPPALFTCMKWMQVVSTIKLKSFERKSLLGISQTAVLSSVKLIARSKWNWNSNTVKSKIKCNY
jgi:hypothetical protein